MGDISMGQNRGRGDVCAEVAMVLAAGCCMGVWGGGGGIDVDIGCS
jgi:hypothetical protein